MGGAARSELPGPYDSTRRPALHREDLQRVRPHDLVVAALLSREP